MQPRTLLQHSPHTANPHTRAPATQLPHTANRREWMPHSLHKGLAQGFGLMARCAIVAAAKNIRAYTLP